MARRHYIDNAPVATFGPVGTTDTSWVISSATGFPTSFPFNVTLGLGTASQENVSITNVVGSTVTVVRNVDSLGAYTHPAGETFQHTALAIDYDEANAHINATSGVHGVSGAVVGTTDTQVLSNKTFAGLSLTANSGVVGLTITGDNTGHLANFKNGATTVASVDKDGNLAAKVATVTQVTSSGTIGGTDITASGDVNVGDDLTVTDAASIGGNLTVTGTANTGAATLASVAVTAGATVGTTLAVAGASTLHATGVTTFSASGASALAAVTATTVTSRIIPPVYANEAARDTAIPSPTTGEMISLTAPTTGARGKCIEEYNGSGWTRYAYGTRTSFTPTWSAAGDVAFALGNGTLLGFYTIHGDLCHVFISLTTGSSTTFGTGGYSCTLPVAAASIGGQQGILAKAEVNAGAAAYVGAGLIADGGSTISPVFPQTAAITTVAVAQNVSTPGGGGGTGIPAVAGIGSYGAGSRIVMYGAYYIA